MTKNPEWYAGEDYLLDADHSWRLGMSAQLWPVFDIYEVVHDMGIGYVAHYEGQEQIGQQPPWHAIRALGTPRLYYPMARPELPFELAKVKDGDEESALGFASKWCLLGHYEITPRERAPLIRDWGKSTQNYELLRQIDQDLTHPLHGDPLVFIWGHAYNVSRVLKLYRFLKSKEYERIREFLSAVTWDVPGWIIWKHGSMLTVRVRDPQDWNQEELAQYLIERTVGDNLLRIEQGFGVRNKELKAVLPG